MGAQALFLPKINDTPRLSLHFSEERMKKRKNKRRGGTVREGR